MTQRTNLGRALAGVVLAGVLATGCGGGRDLTPEELADRHASQLRFWGVQICEEQVTRLLVAPSTAVWEPGTGRSRQVTVDADSGVVRVRHFVDAQNRMGAQIRNHFVCEVMHAGGSNYRENWRVRDVRFVD